MDTHIMSHIMSTHIMSHIMSRVMKGDEDTLTNGKWLSASHISAAQYMLKQRYLDKTVF